jgi:hypothetical protein
METSLLCPVALAFERGGRDKYVTLAFLCFVSSVTEIFYRFLVDDGCASYQHETPTMAGFVFTPLSMVTWLFIILAWRRRTRRWDKVVVGTFIFWVSGFVAAIVAVEIMTAWVFDDGTGVVITLTASSWQLGHGYLCFGSSDMGSCILLSSEHRRLRQSSLLSGVSWPE